MKQAGWRVDSRGRPGKRTGKSTPRRRQQAIARIQAAVKKIKNQNQKSRTPHQGFFNALVAVATVAPPGLNP